jgi:hypothetical protein
VSAKDTLEILCSEAIAADVEEQCRIVPVVHVLDVLDGSMNICQSNEYTKGTRRRKSRKRRCKDDIKVFMESDTLVLLTLFFFKRSNFVLKNLYLSAVRLCPQIKSNQIASFA